MIVYGTKYATTAHGLWTALPELPKGWHWVQSPHDWLLARSPDGEEYYADFHAEGRFVLALKNVATWWEWVRTWGALKPGEVYRDERTQLHFQSVPQSQT